MRGARKTLAASAGDWTRFGWDARRSNDDPHATGITAANVASLAREQTQLAGTVDSSAIYLHGVKIRSATHDAFFVTTTYGITLAIDAASGTILWRWTPPSYSSVAGSDADHDGDAGRRSEPQVDLCRVAGRPDPEAHGGERPRSLAPVDHEAPTREKIASSLNFADGHVIATTGGYIGDAPPYQGHVAIISAGGRLLHVWNSLCSNRHGLLVPSACPASDSAIWGRAGAVVDPAQRQAPRGHGQRAVERPRQLGRRRARPLGEGETDRELHAHGHRAAERQRPRSRLDVARVPHAEA